MAALFILSWKLSLVCFALLPLLIAGAAAFSYTSHNAFREVRLKIAALNSMIQENLARHNRREGLLPRMAHGGQVQPA